MNSTLSTSAQFFPRLIILGFDNLGVEDFLVEEDAKKMIALFMVKELEDQKKRRRGSMVNHMCIP
jgi:hypothetical protein